MAEKRCESHGSHLFLSNLFFNAPLSSLFGKLQQSCHPGNQDDSHESCGPGKAHSQVAILGDQVRHHTGQDTASNEGRTEGTAGGKGFGRFRLQFRIHQTQQQETGCHHAAGRAEYHDGIFEPVGLEQTRPEEEQQSRHDDHEGPLLDDQRQGIFYDDGNLDRSDGPGYQEFQRQPLDTAHGGTVDAFVIFCLDDQRLDHQSTQHGCNEPVQIEVEEQFHGPHQQITDDDSPAHQSGMESKDIDDVPADGDIGADFTVIMAQQFIHLFIMGGDVMNVPFPGCIVDGDGPTDDPVQQA